VKRLFVLCLIIVTISVRSLSEENCLFKNPLCFYKTDVLCYIQVLHKNQQYANMAAFFYGPIMDRKGINHVKQLFSKTEFGYTLKRVGIINLTNKKWSLTYQRTIMGTNETFTIDCAVINDTCKIYLDQESWNKIFKK
jgi:hypothetical protein